MIEAMRTKAKTKPRKKGPLATADHCQGCGKPIARQLVAQALCVSCRYHREWVSEDPAEQGDEQEANA